MANRFSTIKKISKDEVEGIEPVNHSVIINVEALREQVAKEKADYDQSKALLDEIEAALLNK